MKKIPCGILTRCYSALHNLTWIELYVVIFCHCSNVSLLQSFNLVNCFNNGRNWLIDCYNSSSDEIQLDSVLKSPIMRKVGKRSLAFSESQYTIHSGRLLSKVYGFFVIEWIMSLQFCLINSILIKFPLNIFSTETKEHILLACFHIQQYYF